MAKITFEVEIDELENDQLDSASDALSTVLNSNKVLGQTVTVIDELDREEDDED